MYRKGRPSNLTVVIGETELRFIELLLQCAQRSRLNVAGGSCGAVLPVRPQESPDEPDKSGHRNSHISITRAVQPPCCSMSVLPLNPGLRSR